MQKSERRSTRSNNWFSYHFRFLDTARPKKATLDELDVERSARTREGREGQDAVSELRAVLSAKESNLVDLQEKFQAGKGLIFNLESRSSTQRPLQPRASIIFVLTYLFSILGFLLEFYSQERARVRSEKN